MGLSLPTEIASLLEHHPADWLTHASRSRAFLPLLYSRPADRSLYFDMGKTILSFKVNRHLDGASHQVEGEPKAKGRGGENGTDYGYKDKSPDIASSTYFSIFPTVGSTRYSIGIRFPDVCSREIPSLEFVRLALAASVGTRSTLSKTAFSPSSQAIGLIFAYGLDPETPKGLFLHMESIRPRRQSQATVAFHGTSSKCRQTIGRYK